MKTFVLLLICHVLAFNLTQSQSNITIVQPDTESDDVVRVCQRSNVILRCRVLFMNDETVGSWNRNDTRVSAENDTQNHFFKYNSDGQRLTDLIITDIGTEDNNTLYTCFHGSISTNDSVLLYVEGSPLPPGDITIDEGCLNFTASWDPVTSDPVCGPLLYNVIISPSDGVVMMKITDTFYNFTNLTSDVTFTLSVAGRNDAGVGTSYNTSITTPGPPSPNGVIEVNTSCLSFIASWNPFTSHPLCEPLSYIVTTSPSDGVMLIELTDTSYNLTRLTSGNSYTITVAGRDGAGVEESTMRATSMCGGGGGGGGDGGCWLLPCLFIIIACILMLIILIDCGCYYYIYKKVKSESEPHPIIVIIFVTLTLGIGWLLYKYLLNSKGPSKIGMQDTEKTPSPDDEPVAYTTTETDRVTFGTGGITYADIDIGKGPAAPGSIFPQDKPTYGQVKPSN